MKIILVNEIDTLGKAGEIVEVADGYARNYLLPKKIAIKATKNNINKIQKIKENAEKEKLKKVEEYKIKVKKIEDTELVFTRKVDEKDNLYGSVSENDIYEKLIKKGVNIDKYAIKLDKHLKELGEFEVKVEFTPEISANLKVKVEKE